MQEIWVEEHDSDVRFQTGSRNEPGLRMCVEITLIYGRIAEIPASYRPSCDIMTVSAIMDSAMGKIPRSTERISSY